MSSDAETVFTLTPFSPLRLRYRLSTTSAAAVATNEITTTKGISMAKDILGFGLVPDADGAVSVNVVFGLPDLAIVVVFVTLGTLDSKGKSEMATNADGTYCA